MILDMMILKIRIFYREHIFVPHNVLKNMDYSGGTLNYQGIELLRVVERDFFSGCKYFNCIFPSKTTIIRYGNKAEKHGSSIAPLKSLYVPSGECFDLD